MKKTISALAALIMLLTLNARSGLTATTDCAISGCMCALTEAGPIECYFDNGSSAGSITGVGTGQGHLSFSEGYLLITRALNPTVWIHNVQNGSTCNITTSTAIVYGVVFGSYAYLTGSGTDTVQKVALNCSGSVPIAVGDGPWGITKDSTTVYILNSYDANISTITPPAETSTPHSIGRVLGDQLTSVRYHAGNNVLYVGGLAGIWEVPLPLSGSSSLLQALPSRPAEMEITDTHIATESNLGNCAYLVPIASPANYLTISSASNISVALSSDTWYTVGHNTPDMGVRAWDLSGSQLPYSPVTTAVVESAVYVWPSATAICGNGTAETGEDCDGTDLRGQDCTNHAFDAGTLACSSCSWDTGGCYNFVCGNNTQEGTEECDGTDLLGQDCTDHGFDAGTLACTSCSWNTSGCYDYQCGNGTQEPGEACDGGDLNGQTCQTQGFAGGNLGCNAGSCTFNTTQCTLCGNNVADTGEDCDGADLSGMTCATLGLGTGNLGCTGLCTWETSGCSQPPVCGNGNLEPGEQCDNGTANSDTLPNACRTNCHLPSCGDNVTDTGEQCDDGNNAAGDGCDAICQIEPGCGNGQLDVGEECDDGDNNSDTAPNACRMDCTDPGCGDGVIDDGEKCDGASLGGRTCANLDQGFTGGTLSCNTTCDGFDTAQCTQEVCEFDDESEILTLKSDFDTGRLVEGSLAKATYDDEIANLTHVCNVECGADPLFPDIPMLYVVTPPGSYCNFSITSPTAVNMYHLSNPDGEGKARFRRDRPDINGIVAGSRLMHLHEGTDTDTAIGGIGAGTLGTGALYWNPQYDPSNPSHPGNWLRMEVFESKVHLYESSTNWVDLTYNHGIVDINLDAVGDLSRFNLDIDPPPKKDCNGCSQGGKPDAQGVLLFLIIFFWLALRSGTGRMVMERIRNRRK